MTMIINVVPIQMWLPIITFGIIFVGFAMLIIKNKLQCQEGHKMIIVKAFDKYFIFDKRLHILHRVKNK